MVIFSIPNVTLITIGQDVLVNVLNAFRQESELQGVDFTRRWLLMPYEKIRIYSHRLTSTKKLYFVIIMSDIEDWVDREGK